MFVKRAGHWRNAVDLSVYLTPVTGTFSHFLRKSELFDLMVYENV